MRLVFVSLILSLSSPTLASTFFRDPQYFWGTAIALRGLLSYPAIESTSSTESEESLTSGEMFSELREAIRRRDPLSCSRLLEYPEMSKLSVTEIKTLLDKAYERTIYKSGMDVFECLLEDVLTRLVPMHFSDALMDFIPYALMPRCPLWLFKAALQHIHLLDANETNRLLKFIKELSENWTDRYSRLSWTILELEKSLVAIDVWDLPLAVEKMQVVSERAVRSQAPSADLLNLIYVSTNIVAVWKTPGRSIDDVLVAIDSYFHNTLDIMKYPLHFVLSQMQIVLQSILEDEINDLQVPITKRLHYLIKQYAQPTRQNVLIGYEDLSLYVKHNLVYLIDIRLSYTPQTSRIPSPTAISLLKLADKQHPYDSKCIVVLLKHIRFREIGIQSATLFSTFSPRLRFYLTGVTSFPAPISPSELCSDSPFHRTLKWKLPPRFLERNHEGDLLFEYYELISLFLFRVFSIPLEKTRVSIDMNEVPDERDIISTIEFLGQRWCQLQSSNNFIYRLELEL